MFEAADEFRKLLEVRGPGRWSRWATNVVIAAAVAIPLIAVFLIVRLVVASAYDSLTMTPAEPAGAPASVTVLLPPPTEPLYLAAIVSQRPPPPAVVVERRQAKSRKWQVTGLSPRLPATATAKAPAATQAPAARSCPPGSALCIDDGAERSVVSLFAHGSDGTSDRNPKKLELGAVQPASVPEKPAAPAQ